MSRVLRHLSVRTSRLWYKVPNFLCIILLLLIYVPTRNKVLSNNIHTQQSYVVRA